MLDNAIGGQRINSWGKRQNKEQGQDGVNRNWQSPDIKGAVGQSLEIV